MAGNKELIDEIVDPIAVKQVTDLKKYIDELEVSFVKLAKGATAANNATGGSNSGSGFTKTVEASNKATKALVDNAEKTRLAEIRLQQAREKAFDAFERKSAKQEADAAKTSSAYYKLEQAYNAVNKEAKNAAVQFGLTSYQLKEASAQALGLRKRLDEIDQPLGNYGRNVGNYQGKFNSLGNSINQLTRELPAFAVSAQTDILALSNNLPIFFDQISAARAEVKALRAEGQQTPSVLSRLASSFFSVGTALSLGVTLLTIYGKEIGNFVAALVEGTKSLDIFAEKQKAINDAFKSSDFKNTVSNFAELKTNVDLAKKGFLDKESVLKQYNETIGKTTGFAETFNEAEKILLQKGNDVIQLTILKAAAQTLLTKASEKASERAIEQNKTDKEAIKVTDQYGASLKKTSSLLKNIINPFGKRDAGNTDFKKIAEENRKQSSDSLDKQIEDYTKALQTIQTQAAKFAKEKKIDFFGGDENERKKAAEEARKKAIEDAKKRADEAKKAAEDASKAEDEAQKRAFDDRIRALQAEIKLQEEVDKEEADLRKKSLDDATNFENDANNKRLLLNDQIANEEYAVLQQQYKDRLISEQEFQDIKQDIERESALRSIDSAIVEAENLIEIQRSFGKDTQAEEDKLAALKIKRSKLVLDNTLSDIEKEKAARKSLNELTKQVEQEAFNFIVTLVNAGFENRKNKIQEQINLTDENAKAEIDAVNRSLISNADKADKIRLIEAQADAQKKQLQREQKRVDQEKAKFDKAVSIARIIEATAIAEIQALSYLSNPITAPLYPGIAGLIAALGAIQLATVLATPIPAYEKGTRNAKGGTSLVGEKGAEYVITPNGATFLTPNKPTLMDIPKGSTVIPHLQTARMMDVQKYAGGQAVDMSEVVNAIKAKQFKSGKTVVSGWRNEVKAVSSWEQRKNQYFRN